MRSTAIEQIEGFCRQVSVGLDSLSGTEKQELLRLLVDRITVVDGNVKVKTIIPSDGDTDGYLYTRDPELDSESPKKPFATGQPPRPRSG